MSLLFFPQGLQGERGVRGTPGEKVFRIHTDQLMPLPQKRERMLGALHCVCMCACMCVRAHMCVPGVHVLAHFVQWKQSVQTGKSLVLWPSCPGRGKTFQAKVPWIGARKTRKELVSGTHILHGILYNFLVLICSFDMCNAMYVQHSSRSQGLQTLPPPSHHPFP